MGDFNLALVIVAVVVSVLVLLVSFYLLINYQHPDDANQAYFPKLVVVLGLAVAAISILMLPADVANRQACRHAIYNGACNLTLPMKTLWLIVYIVDAVLVFLVIPFAMFYYEGDLDKCVLKFESILVNFCVNLFGIYLIGSGILSQERWKEIEECVDLGVLLGVCLRSLPWNSLRYTILLFISCFLAHFFLLKCSLH